MALKVELVTEELLTSHIRFAKFMLNGYGFTTFLSVDLDSSAAPPPPQAPKNNSPDKAATIPKLFSFLYSSYVLPPTAYKPYRI